VKIINILFYIVINSSAKKIKKININIYITVKQLCLLESAEAPHRGKSLLQRTKFATDSYVRLLFLWWSQSSEISFKSWN